jgi:hypothetical protein
MIIPDSEKSGINEALNIPDYLGPARANVETGSVACASVQARKQAREANRD